MCACTQTGIKEMSDGMVVTVHPNKSTDAKHIRLQVMGDQLIRVSATNENRFSDRKSLIIVPQTAEQTQFSVEKTEGSVALATSKVKATVNTSTGEVVFTDLQGKVLLAENKGGGKSFTPIEVEGKKEYSIRQVFESPEDEAFFGLGQHHSGEFNYKGKNEELYQYNSKVSLPFIVSNKGYGILWDSYSLSRFGNPNEY
jgi:alpha-D-xyloside xylohydrolase